MERVVTTNEEFQHCTKCKHFKKRFLQSPEYAECRNAHNVGSNDWNECIAVGLVPHAIQVRKYTLKLSRTCPGYEEK